ncbi:BZ3500_MvSof-1268-A1-R1_Chr7-3g09702 [Microbotryum saponariae]|uniref:BZ3500_MvSof-1268-A1-R1_Chr7-3g09702 protein n=1 Tax=Microbotryum saponariae TaxID=289078 RepID=A0A2X0L198_9BASI|nr:BZ3501_MvSof-1269-A2-R1_Chr7-2g09425 [Microbotryum saponariae]SDA02443.1 BZ3500_MvSof-1268-A1-R1_Chr7-3g09702 [Microbotryum saponariae]
MKYSLVFVALVVIATVNGSRLPADATEFSPTSEVDDLHALDEHTPLRARSRPSIPLPAVEPE